MNGLPSQLTAAALATVVILGVQMLASLEVFTLTEDQIRSIDLFVVAVANLGFGFLLWWVNREHPNPTAPTPPPAPPAP
jgi:hypothetical protein